MTKKTLIFLSKAFDKIGNIKPIFAILAFILFMVGRDIAKQVFRPITINSANISKRETQNQILIENENIKKAFQRIEVYNYNLDSCKYELVSIQYRKRSNLDTLQSFFNNY
ncbi:hypothetical protein [Lacihabitans soyangensis]|uniref:hypothetical protein n=1 Tax=Lacihabitans soyangensis TaxID=869394 RepID=UPI0020CED866|nr:hypothetical protein [Lacihabitans soyangensis]